MKNQVQLLSYVILYAIAPQIQRKCSVDTHILPDVEDKIFHNLKEFIKRKSNLKLDILAACIYLLHFPLPILYCILLNKTGKNHWDWLGFFGKNAAMILLFQIIVQTAPPWFNDKIDRRDTSIKVINNKSIKGECGNLSRIDDFIGFPLFKHLYGANQMIFASFPSFHVIWPLLITQYSKKYKAIGYMYVLLVSWAAVYLNHHYITDILGSFIFVKLLT